MKKILSVFVALVLVFALCAMPASAETKASEWKKGTGPATIDFSDEGTKIGINEGVCLYYYQNLINIKDFTVKVKFNTPEKGELGYYAFVIGGNGKHTGAQGAQNFVVMWYRNDKLCINPQVLHNGQSTIKPVSSNLYIDITEGDVLFHFKQVDELTYSVEVEEAGYYYEYSIPENFNWCEDLNGEGALGFGGLIGASIVEKYGENSFNMVVKEINGVKMNGKNEPVSSDTTGGTTGGSGTTGGNSNIDPETGLNTGIIGGDVTDDVATENEATEETSFSTMWIIVIIACGFVIIIVVNVIVITILFKKKNAPAEEVEEVAEEVTEETTEE